MVVHWAKLKGNSLKAFDLCLKFAKGTIEGVRKERIKFCGQV